MSSLLYVNVQLKIFIRDAKCFVWLVVKVVFIYHMRETQEILWIHVLLSACGWCCNRFVEAAALIFELGIVGGGGCWLLTPVGRNWASGFDSPGLILCSIVFADSAVMHMCWLVVQLLQAMQCHITECARVCVCICRWQLSVALGCSAPGQSCFP